MYIPKFNLVDDDGEIRDFVAAFGAGNLITVGPDGAPDVTLLPILWEGDRIQAHMAAANQHWRRIVDGSAATVAVDGPDVYVSPSWYATKAEHGKVVPTWNYSSVHISGTVQVIRDEAWLRDQIERLTNTHEKSRSGWQVGDAPETYIDRQIRGIVGVEIVVERVEGKAKLSQNRSEEDRSGVIEALRAEATPAGMAVAEAMKSDRMIC